MVCSGLKMEKPFISVICPIRNEARHFAECLQSITSQDYDPARFEVLVVDGMSDDQTRAIVEDFQKRDNRIKLLDNPGRIVPSAMNIGIRQARGKVIIRVDGHAVIAGQYLSRCIQFLEKTGADCVGGAISSVNHTFIGKAIAAAMSSPFGVGNSAFRTSQAEGYVDTLAFGAYRAEVFKKIGLFDEELVRCQDDELNYRLRKFGGKIYLTPEIRSKYYPRTNLKKLVRQFAQYGYWKVRVLQKHPLMMQLRQFVPPLFVLAQMAAIVAAIFWPPAWIVLALILGSYVLAVVLATVAISIKRDVRYFAVLPIIFPILHYCYGGGFLTGLIKFARRWQKP